MEDLKYTRNIQAVHLAKGYSNMLGIVLPNIEHSYFSTLVTGIAEKAQARGMHFALFQTGYDPLKRKSVNEFKRTPCGRFNILFKCVK